MSEKIKVLIVDDSALRREILKSILDSDPSIKVTGMAKNGKEGFEKTFALKPDLITMDLSMPVMDGFEATKRIMQELPTPIIVVSSLNTELIVKALNNGAMDFIAVTGGIEQITEDLLEKVKVVSRIKPIRRIKLASHRTDKTTRQGEMSKVVAIGVSTGGPQALKIVLSELPANFSAGTLIVQHMAKGFINGLAEWLRQSCPLDIRVAKAGDVVERAVVLLAPDDFHMTVSANHIISLSGDAGNTATHIPSVGTMMKSVAKSYGENSIGVIMTGMGYDGVEGIKAIKNAGGVTIAQDEKSSAIFGMNKAAIATGCIDKTVPLENIAEEIIKEVQAVYRCERNVSLTRGDRK